MYHTIRGRGGGGVKKWLTSWEDPVSEKKSMLDNPKEDYNERVLGMQWNPKNDVSKFSKKRGEFLFLPTYLPSN